MNTVLELRRPEDAAEVAAALLRACPGRRVFTFNGPMGVGKTTLIKALCASLGVEVGMASPSYSIVNEYRTLDGNTVYHFDLYRLNKAEELEGIGFTEYLDSGHYCFIEWPELGQGSYPPDTVNINMNMTEDDTRSLEVVQPTPAHKHLA